MDATQLRVGFVGLGGMGGPMATRIAAAGFPLTVWARRREVLDQFPTARPAATPAALGAEVDVACVCVLADADVEEVCTAGDGLLAGLAPGTVLLVHSTVRPATVVELAATAATTGVDVLDVPVSGGGPIAAEGQLCSIVGGSAAVLDRVRPILATHSHQIVHVGEVGAAQQAKLLNNALFYAQAGLARGLLQLAATLGLDADAFASVVGQSSGRSWAFDMMSRTPGASLDAAVAYFTKLQRKDLALVAALIGESEVIDALAAAAEIDTELTSRPRPPE